MTTKSVNSNISVDFHQVVAVESNIKRVIPDWKDEPYFVKNLLITTVDHTGVETVTTITLFSKTRDEFEVTEMPEGSRAAAQERGCPVCNGRGLVDDAHCVTCDGTGEREPDMVAQAEAQGRVESIVLEGESS